MAQNPTGAENDRPEPIWMAEAATPHLSAHSRASRGRRSRVGLTRARVGAILVGLVMIGSAVALTGTAKAGISPTIICCSGGSGPAPTWYNVSTGNWGGIEVAEGGMTSYGGEVYIPPLSQLTCPLMPGQTNNVCGVSLWAGEGGDPGFLSNGQEFPFWQAGVILAIPHTCSPSTNYYAYLDLFTYGMANGNDWETVPMIGTATHGCLGSMTVGSVNFGEWLSITLSNNRNTGAASAQLIDNEGNWIGTNSNLTHDTFHNGELIAETYAFQDLYTVQPNSAGYAFGNLPIPSGSTQIGMLSGYVYNGVQGCFNPSVPVSSAFSVTYSTTNCA